MFACSDGGLGSGCVSESSVGGKVFFLLRLAPYLVAAGCLLDVLSTFFPWAVAYGEHWFLPFSVPLPVGWRVLFLEDSFSVLVVNIAVRLAAVLGLLALLLYAYLKNVLPTLILLVSISLSFVSFLVFSDSVGWAFSYGVYMVVAGGLLKLFGLILKKWAMKIKTNSIDQAS